MPIRFRLRSIVMLFTMLILGGVSFASAQTEVTDQWARWRGPNGNGIASDDQKPPTRWSDTENIVWKTKVPGRGHASPIVLGDAIFLATADEATETQSVLCFDRETGRQRWQTEISQGGFASRIHGKNTHASSTVATDGKHLFAVFSHHGKVTLTALTLAGDLAWTQEVGPYDPAYPFGFGASPIVEGSLVIVTNENRADGGLTAYDVATGAQQWKIDRNQVSSYSTPVVAEIAGQRQLLISGGKQVASYSPQDGSRNWSAPAAWIVTCGTLVWDGDLVFASGGFPAPQTVAVNARNGEVVWTNRNKAYEQSMLAHQGYLYSLTDRGVIYCWRASDGQQMWAERFTSPVSASPTLVNGNLYFTAENGQTVVVQATPEAYREIASNRLGDSAFATPAFCGDRIFTRVRSDDQGYLICIGQP